MNRKILWVVIVNSLLGIAMIVSTALCLNKLEWYLQAASYVCVAVFTVGALVCWFLKRDGLTKSFFLLNIVAFILIGSLTVMNLCGIFESLSDLEKVKDLIISAGGWGYVVYALLTILNVVVLPMPGWLFMLAGLAVFGQWNTFLVTYASFLAGSFIAFALGRVCGRKAVVWCIGEEKTEKYSKIVGKKGHVAFVFMQILPFFPDDILCMVAGLTSMSWKFFSVSMILIRPIYIAAVCFLGTGTVIPFSGWGIPVWIAIFAVFGVLFILFCKYQEKIENWFGKLFKKKKARGVENADDGKTEEESGNVDEGGNVDNDETASDNVNIDENK